MIRNRWWSQVLAAVTATAAVFGHAASATADEPRRGTVEGRVVEVGDRAFVVYSPLFDERATFTPRWVGGHPRDGGGLDEKTLGRIRELREGMTVRVEWVYDERPRAVAIEVLDRPASEGERRRPRDDDREGDGDREREMDRERDDRETDREHGDREREREADREGDREGDGDREREMDRGRGDDERERGRYRDGDRGRETRRDREAGREGDRHAERDRDPTRDREHAGDHDWGEAGVITGELIAKTDRSITVRDAETRRTLKLIPHWRGGMPADGGGPDERMLRIIRELRVGSVVQVRWEFVEHHRVVGVKLLKPATPDRARRDRDDDRRDED